MDIHSEHFFFLEIDFIVSLTPDVTNPLTIAKNPVTRRLPSGRAHPREAPITTPNIKNNLFITQFFVTNTYSFAIPGYFDALISGYFAGKNCEVS